MIRLSQHLAPREPGAPRRSPTGAGCVRAVLACVVLAAAGGCEDARDDTPVAAAPQVDAVRAAGAAVPGARYHTELTFVGTGQPPTLLHLRFDNFQP